MLGAGLEGAGASAGAMGRGGGSLTYRGGFGGWRLDRAGPGALGGRAPSKSGRTEMGVKLKERK